MIAFKPSVGAKEVKAPELVVIDCTIDRAYKFANVVVSYDRDGKPLSHLSDDVWDFRPYSSAKTESGSAVAVWDWSNVATAFRLPLKKMMYLHLFEKRRTTPNGLNSVYRTFANWSVLSNICEQRGVPSLSSLRSAKMQRKLLAGLYGRRLSYGTVERYLTSINIAAELGFTSFEIGSVSKLAKRLSDASKGNGQTLAIPQALAAQIYAYAINKVEMWHQRKEELSIYFHDYISLVEQEKSFEHFRVFFDASDFLSPDIRPNQKTNKYGSKSVTALYNDILIACGTVIGAVSGMRMTEWFELDADSYQVEKYKGITHHILVGKTSKLNSGIPTRHAWVTAPIARLAIELLTAITHARRERILATSNVEASNGSHKKAEKLKDISQCLFLSLGIEGKALTLSNTALRKAMKRLVESCPNDDGTTGARLREEHLEEFKVLNRDNSDAVLVGEYWPLLTHQFRRTFAVFLIRNGFGSFIQVKEQFAHANISMSIWYGRNADVAITLDLAQDSEIQAEIAEMNALLMTDVAEQIFLGDAPISGGGGKRIRDQIGNGNIVFESREEVEAAIKSGSLTIIDNGHSLCLNPKCSRLDCTIDPAVNAVTCNHDVIMPLHANKRVELRERLINRHKNAIEAGLKQPNLITKTLIGIRACEQVLREHNIPFEPYGQLIEVTRG
ncbi:MAG: hypothetical protein AAGJ33_07555 [Pseudomonadota bacterium]